MPRRSSEADNVLPRLPQGLDYGGESPSRSAPSWFLQRSAVLTVVLQASAVAHLLQTRFSRTNPHYTKDYLPVS